MAQFGDRLRLAMTHAKVSLEALAEAMEIHPQTLSRWRQQDGEPRDRHRVELAAKRLDVDVEWLLTGRAVKGGKSFPVGFMHEGRLVSVADLVRPATVPGKPASQGRETRSSSGSAQGEPDVPAPAFIEHVLFTAGRIAELANQIASAAAQQQRVSYELGQRAESEGRRPTIAEAIAQGDEARTVVSRGKGKAAKASGARKKRRS